MSDDTEDDKSTGPRVTEGAATPAAAATARHVTPGTVPHYVTAARQELLARGRQVRVEGARPSMSDARLLLAPPWGDPEALASRLAALWDERPLIRSAAAREALDHALDTPKAEQLAKLREVLARDLAII